MRKKHKKPQAPEIGPDQQTKIIPWSYAEKIEQTIDLKLTLEILKNQTNEDMTKTAAYMFLSTILGYLVEKAPLFEERKLPPMQMEFYSVIFVAACGGIYCYWRKAQIPDIIADGFDSLDVYDPNILNTRINTLLSENHGQMGAKSLINTINSTSIYAIILIAFFSCVNGQMSSTICTVLPLLFLKIFLNRDGALRRVLYDENTINLRTVKNILTTQYAEIIDLLEEINKNNKFLEINYEESRDSLDQRHHQSISLRDKRILCTLQLYKRYRNLDIRYVNKELCYMLSLVNVLSYPNLYTNRQRKGITIMTTSAFSKKAPLISKDHLVKTLNQRLDFICDVKCAKVSVPTLLNTISNRFKGDWHWSYINVKEYNLALCFSVLPDTPADKAAIKEFFNRAAPTILSEEEDEQECHIICYDINRLIVLLGLDQKQQYRPLKQKEPELSSNPRSNPRPIPSMPERILPKKEKRHSNPSDSTSSKKFVFNPSSASSSHLPSIASMQDTPNKTTVQDEKGIRVNGFQQPNRFFYVPNSALEEMDAVISNKKASKKMCLILRTGTCLSPADRGTQGIKVYGTKKEGEQEFKLVLKPKAAFGSLRVHFIQSAVIKEKDGSTKYEMSFQKMERK